MLTKSIINTHEATTRPQPASPRSLGMWKNVVPRPSIKRIRPALPAATPVAASLFALVLNLVASELAHAQTYAFLHSFSGQSDTLWRRIDDPRCSIGADSASLERCCAGHCIDSPLRNSGGGTIYRRRHCRGSGNRKLCCGADDPTCRKRAERSRNK